MSRARRWALILVGALALALLLAALVAIGHSTRFAGWLLPRVLPAGATVAEVQGSLAGGLELSGFAMPGVRIERLSLAAALWPSLLGTPTLARLDAAGIRVDPAALPADEAEAETEATPWPRELPRFAVGPVSIRDLEIAGDTPIRIDAAGWQALQSRGAVLALDGLRVEGPDLLLRADGTVGLRGASALTGEFRYQRYAGRLRLGGDPAQRVELGVGLTAPLAAELQAQIRGWPDAPSGALRLQLPTVPTDTPGLEALAPLAPLAADLTLRGDLQRVRIDGLLTVQGQALRLDGSEVQGSAERLTLAPLRIAHESGELRVEGEWPLQPAQPAGSLRLRGRDLAWPAMPAALNALNAELRGRSEALTFVVDATVEPEAGPVPVQLEGQWGDGELRLARFSLTDALRGDLRYGVADGAVDANVAVQGLDLGRWLPAHPTRLEGALSLRGAVGAWQLSVADLSGEWRGLPLSLRGDVAWDGQGLPAGTLEARLDGNRLQLEPIEAGHRATLEVGAIGALLPGAEATGRVLLTQRGEVVDWQLALDRARWSTAEGPLQFDDLQARGRLQLRDQPSGELDVQLARLTRGDVAYGPLRLDFSGDATRHRLTLDAEAPQGRATLSAAGGQQPGGWSGAIEQLTLAPTGLPAPPLQLAAALPLDLLDGRLTLGRGCLAREAATLCVGGGLSTGDDAAGALNVALSGLDLGLLPREESAAWRLRGVLDGGAELSLAGMTVSTLSARLSAPEVQLTLDREEGDKTFALEQLRLSVDGPPTALAARLGTTLQGAGPLTLAVDGLGGPDLAGQLEVDFTSLAVLNGLSPELVAPEGRLAGRLSLAGSTEALDIGGELTLGALRAELPGAGLKIVDGELALRFPAPGRAVLAGTIGTGEGLLRIEAEATRGADGQPELTARLDGERVLVADLPNVRLLASPAVQLQTRDGVLVASGTLGLPEGRLDLERFEPGVSASADVVVLDRPVSTPAPVRTDIRYTLGPALKLKGFGLDAGLRGGLRIRSRPGRPVTASGTLDLTGGYRAYGQNLTIDRGRLLWANAPIGNPGFDFSAYRTIDQLKAGVRVRGSANAPELTVYTDPPREASDALSWLVLGRPLSSASGDDGQQLSAAAGALGSVGGALIGATIGQRLGVEINIESSAELGGSPAFTVGKMLSPKLFVGFGRSLFDSAQLVIVRYRLTEHYELEALSGRESKLGANYRLER